jgi:hypothetical protein
MELHDLKNFCLEANLLSLADAMRRYTILTLSGRCAMVIFPDPPGEYDFAMRAMLSIGNIQKMENP